MDFLEWVKGNLVIVIFGTITLVQISPIKIDPWTWLLKKCRDIMLGEDFKKLQNDISDLKKTQAEIQKNVTDEKVAETRWNILAFATSCRKGEQHTLEEWRHCSEQLDWYEKYCQDNKVSNGVIKQASAFIRSMYGQHLIDNDFLE